VSLSNNLTAIGDEAFSGCTCLKSLIIPEKVTSIGVMAFDNCTQLEIITIPNGVESIGNGAFLGCRSLTALELPDGIEKIANFTFYNCSGISSLRIPDGVTSIGHQAFDGCGVQELKLPKALKTVYDFAFQNCMSLASISFPQSIEKLGSGILENCNNLGEIICYAENIPETDASTFKNIDQKTMKLYVPENSLEIYTNTIPWSLFGHIIAIKDGQTEVKLVYDNSLDHKSYIVYNSRGEIVRHVFNSTLKDALVGLPLGVYVVNGKKMVLK
jgi:hypothetical protein